MHTWPGGHRHAMLQAEHKEWNRTHYPGTRQLCSICGQETGRCEEDSMYTDEGNGPLCIGCYHEESSRDGNLLKRESL
jgi:hypothetical protein